MQVSQGFLHSLIQSSREQLLETRSLDQETDFQEASQLQIRGRSAPEEAWAVPVQEGAHNPMARG